MVEIQGWSRDPGPPSGGGFPRYFITKGKENNMSERRLHAFIDESGDFGPYESHAPYYLVSVVLQDQDNDIGEDIKVFNSHLQNIGCKDHAIHTDPLIRRESVYANDLIEERKYLFHALFHFARKLNFQYDCIKVKKSECPDTVAVISKVPKALVNMLYVRKDYWESFDRIVIHYDNGQIELTKILIAVFHMLPVHVEFRKEKPVDNRLFQVADLICTVELLAEKAENKAFSRSEKEFFGSIRDFKKNYLKHIRKKSCRPFP